MSQQAPHLNVQDAKVCHCVLPPLRGAKGLVTQHPMVDHLNSQTKRDNDGHSDQREHWVVGSRSQQAHAMDPDHKEGCSPVMVVACCMFSLCVYIAKRYPP